MCVALSVCLSLCVYFSLSLFLHVCPSLYVSLSVCVPLSLPLPLPLSFLLCVSHSLSDFILCMCVSLSVCVPLCLCPCTCSAEGRPHAVCGLNTGGAYVCGHLCVFRADLLYEIACMCAQCSVSMLSHMCVQLQIVGSHSRVPRWRCLYAVTPCVQVQTVVMWVHALTQVHLYQH